MKSRFQIPPGLLAGLLWGSFCGGGGLVAETVNPVKILVAVPPLVEVAQRIGGEQVVAVSMLQPGDGHEQFALSPKRLLSWQDAEVYWGADLALEASIFPRLKIGAVVGPTPGEGSSDPHLHDEGNHAPVHMEDPHRWLDLSIVADEAQALAQVLAALRPSAEADFHMRSRAFAETCQSLQAEWAAQFADYEGARVYVYHAAWERLMASWGLVEVALEEGGRPPSMHRLRTLAEQAQADQMRTIFVDPLHTTRSARVFARQLGAELVSLDPMAPNWEANLRQVAEQVYAELTRRAQP